MSQPRLGSSIKHKIMNKGTPHAFRDNKINRKVVQMETLQIISKTVLKENKHVNPLESGTGLEHTGTKIC